MLIEDQELRELYAAASKEHLDNLEAGLLALEESALSRDCMNNLLREVHSLKGDSRMLGVAEAESLAHAVEALLQQIAEGEKVTPARCDRLYLGLDAIRGVVHEAVHGVPAEVNLPVVMARLEGKPLASPTASASRGYAPAVKPSEMELQAAASLTAEALEMELSGSAEVSELVPEALVESVVESVEKTADIDGEQVGEVQDRGVQVRDVQSKSDQARDSIAIAANLAIEAHQTAKSSVSKPSTLTPSQSQEQSDLARAFLELAGEMGARVELTEAEALEAEADGLPVVPLWPDEPVAEPSEEPPAEAAIPAVLGVQEELGASSMASSSVTEATAEIYAGFIEDKELRGLYATASAEHLATLETGCLQLEKSPKAFNQFSDLLRAAHSLKGDSRMLGVEAAETLTHQLETLLQEIEQGQQSITPALCDRLYVGIDNLRQIARGAIWGTVPQQSLDEMLAQLRGAAPVATEMSPATVEASSPAPRREQETSPGPDDSIILELTQAPPALPQTEQPKAEMPSPSAIDTIRVASSKLDSLVTQVSELAVTKRRIVQWTDQVMALSDLCEGWSQDSQAQRSLFERIHSELTPETAQLFAESQTATQQKVEALSNWTQQFRSQTADGGARLDAVANGLETDILNLRMLPLSNVFSLFPRLVRDLSKQQKKNVKLVIEGDQTLVDKRILEDIRDPLSHLLRNALDHGIEDPEARVAQGKSPQATLTLRGSQQGSSIVIEVSDDGQGLDIENIKQTAVQRGLVSDADLTQMAPPAIQALIFEPGFSTRSAVTAISGRGVGLDVVKTNVEQLKGSITIHSRPGAGCTFRMVLKPSLATTDALIFNVNQVAYALPIESIDRMLAIAPSDIFTIKGNCVATISGETVSVAWLSDLLNLSGLGKTASQAAEQIDQRSPCIVLQVGTEKIAILVDELREQQEILLKPQSGLLKRVRNIAGSAILGNGEICLVVNPQDLLLTMLKSNRADSAAENRIRAFSSSNKKQPRILLVEDSLPIRTQMKRILESSGYAVTATVDGLDGYNTLRSEEFYFDAVISDVEMPNLTGLELISRIRSHPEYDRLPCLLVTTLAKAEDRQKGIEAGADSYLTKGDFDQNLLLQTLQGLIQK